MSKNQSAMKLSISRTGAVVAILFSLLLLMATAVAINSSRLNRMATTAPVREIDSFIAD